MQREFELTQRTKNIIEKRGLKLLCGRCIEQIEVGQRVVARYAKKGTVYYHASCWNSMFMDVDSSLLQRAQTWLHSISF